MDSLYHIYQYVGLQTDIFYNFLQFLVFLSLFLLRKILPWNMIIFHHNFNFFVVIICIFHLMFLCICRVRHLSDQLRYALLPFLVMMVFKGQPAKSCKMTVTGGDFRHLSAFKQTPEYSILVVPENCSYVF